MATMTGLCILFPDERIVFRPVLVGEHGALREQCDLSSKIPTGRCATSRSRGSEARPCYSLLVPLGSRTWEKVEVRNGNSGVEHQAVALHRLGNQHLPHHDLKRRILPPPGRGTNGGSRRLPQVLCRIVTGRSPVRAVIQLWRSFMGQRGPSTHHNSFWPFCQGTAGDRVRPASH